MKTKNKNNHYKETIAKNKTNMTSLITDIKNQRENDKINHNNKIKTLECENKALLPKINTIEEKLETTQKENNEYTQNELIHTITAILSMLLNLTKMFQTSPPK